MPYREPIFGTVRINYRRPLQEMVATGPHCAIDLPYFTEENFPDPKGVSGVVEVSYGLVPLPPHTCTSTDELPDLLSATEGLIQPYARLGVIVSRLPECKDKATLIPVPAEQYYCCAGGDPCVPKSYCGSIGLGKVATRWCAGFWVVGLRAG